MGRCCLLFLRTRSAPRNWTRFAAQYLARGLPCERFTAALASRTSCITRGRGGWLDLPRGGLAPPILCQLPGALRSGSPRPNLVAPKNWRGLAACATTCNVTLIDPQTSENMRSESLPDLGDLEREVMQLIWANGSLTAEFVRERLARRLKESTVRTVLRRLEEKG